MREFCTKWWKRIAAVDMLFIGVLTLLASLFASWLKQFPGFSLFGALIIALLIGMIIQFPIRSAYVGSNDGRKAGVKDAAGLISNKLLRLGIILLGFKLNLAVLFTQGIKCLPIAAVVVTLTIIVCYAIARKLGVDPMLAILTAGGTGICGAAAVMGLAGSIKVSEDKQDEKDNDVTMAVAIVAIMGTVFALLEIALGPLDRHDQGPAGHHRRCFPARNRPRGRRRRRFRRGGHRHHHEALPRAHARVCRHHYRYLVGEEAL